MQGDMRGKKRNRCKSRSDALRAHFKSLGFTNRLALYLVALLTAGLAGGFLLAKWSIEAKYTGALACYTVVFTPIGTALGAVLGRVVKKNMEENTGADGEGIVYAAAKACGFSEADDISENSPPI